MSEETIRPIKTRTGAIVTETVCRLVISMLLIYNTAQELYTHEPLPIFTVVILLLWTFRPAITTTYHNLKTLNHYHKIERYAKKKENRKI